MSELSIKKIKTALPIRKYTVHIPQSTLQKIGKQFADDEGNGHIMAEFTKVYDKLSPKQRGYYFAVLVRGTAIAMREAGNANIHPDDKDDLVMVHRFLTEKFASTEAQVITPDGEVLDGFKSIRNHSTVDQEEYHFRIRNWVSEIFNYVLPLPNETEHELIEHARKIGMI